MTNMSSTLVINNSYYESGECTYQDLHLAVRKLSNTSEEEFQKIKNETWFTRVFDMVTFSNKKDMRLANQIQSVAQAQEILIQLLVRLSARDQELFELVEDAFSKIERLSRQDLLLAKKLKKLESQFYFGISESISLLDLDEAEKQLLGAILLEISNCYESPSEIQQKYANFILRFANIQEQKLDYQKGLPKITDIEKKKLLLQISLEYIFLHQFDFEMDDQIDEIIAEFDFGRKTINSLKNKIQSVYKLRGAEGFFDRLNIEPLGEEFEIQLDPVEEEVHEDDLMLEELYLHEMLSIKTGEELVMENKIVQIETFVNVEGSLYFKNCIIKYGYNETIKGITVLENGEVHFENCLISREGNNDSYLIEAQGGLISFLQCYLLQCKNLIKGTGQSKVQFMNCDLINPQSKIYSNRFGDLSIRNSRFMVNQDTYEKPKEWFEAESIVIEDSKVQAEKDIYRKEDNAFAYFNKPLFDCSRLQVHSSEFENVEDLFQMISYSDSSEVSMSKFTNCIRLFFSTSECKMSENEFISCSVIFRGKNYTILNSVFEGCQGEILNGNLERMEFCEFYNLYSEGNKNIFTIETSDSRNQTIISKCVFNGVVLDDGFLIAGDVHEKIKNEKIEVRNCEFKNCYTNRQSGKILKEYDRYVNMFNRWKEVKPICFYDCIGLDKVQIRSDDTEVLTVNTSGRKDIKAGLAKAGIIGAATALGTPFSLALAIGIGVSRLLKDDELKEE